VAVVLNGSKTLYRVAAFNCSGWTNSLYSAHRSGDADSSTIFGSFFHFYWEEVRKCLSSSLNDLMHWSASALRL
jgi:hypothetical protein